MLPTNALLRLLPKASIRARERFLAKHKDLLLSDVQCRAFLLPLDKAKWIEKEKEIRVLLGSDAVRERKQSILLLEQESKREPLIQRNAADPIGDTISLCLFELLYRLDTSKDEDVSGAHLWMNLADHFGKWALRYALEDAIFFKREPETAEHLESVLEKRAEQTKQLFEDARSIMQYFLKKEGIHLCQIVMRRKNLYGIYKKMKAKGKSLNNISDIFGLRVIVKTEDDCYKAQKCISRLWPTFPHRLKDYIAHPKENGYQSLHMTIQCLERQTVECQIRTEEMEWVSKFGPAAHKAYKKQQRQENHPKS